MQRVPDRHRADLLTADNAALAAAANDDDCRPVPTLVFDPHCYDDVLARDARRRLLRDPP